MRRFILPAFLLVFVLTLSLFATAGAPAAPGGGGIDWFQLIFEIGYIGGVFILLPIVIYTNFKEKERDSETIVPSPLENLSEEERNERTWEILEKIEQKLTAYKNDEGEDMVTITKGSQAKFIREGLEYIRIYLAPSDEAAIARVEEFSDVYKDRSQRAFTGSKWIIGCSAAVGILFVWSGGISTFIFIHLLGLLFYILSSRTPFYTLEKRMKYFGGTGFMSGILSGLFIGGGTKYYIKHSDGSRSRDWETEGNMAIAGLFIMIIVAAILGFLAAFLGVINFFLNYPTSYLLPFKKNDDWYEKNLAVATA